MDEIAQVPQGNVECFSDEEILNTAVFCVRVGCGGVLSFLSQPFARPRTFILGMPDVETETKVLVVSFDWMHVESKRIHHCTRWRNNATLLQNHIERSGYTGDCAAEPTTSRIQKFWPTL